MRLEINLLNSSTKRNRHRQRSRSFLAPISHKTVFGIGYEYIIDADARRQKWSDQSQSVNLFLATPEMQGASARSNLNRTYRRAWDKRLKTTYYLRTLQASNIEKSAIDVKKEQRGVMATQTAATAAEAETIHRRRKERLLHRCHAKRRHLRGVPINPLKGG